MSKINEALIDQKHSDNEQLDYLYQEQQAMDKKEYFYPFATHREYLHALIRYSHPMHNTAMAIRNKRMMTTQPVVGYDVDGLETATLRDVVDNLNLQRYEQSREQYYE